MSLFAYFSRRLPLLFQQEKGDPRIKGHQHWKLYQQNWRQLEEDNDQIMAENMVLTKQVDLKKEINKHKADLLTLCMELHKEMV